MYIVHNKNREISKDRDYNYNIMVYTVQAICVAGARPSPSDVVTVSIGIATPPDIESSCSSWLKPMVEEEEGG